MIAIKDKRYINIESAAGRSQSGHLTVLVDTISQHSLWPLLIILTNTRVGKANPYVASKRETQSDTASPLLMSDCAKPSTMKADDA